LATTLEQLSAELMAEERIACEAESPLLWLEVEGYPHAYQLHLILNTGRRAEGHWPEAAAAELVMATQRLMVF
jgi:hypothetical protein